MRMATALDGAVRHLRHSLRLLDMTDPGGSYPRGEIRQAQEEIERARERLQALYKPRLRKDLVA